MPDVSVITSAHNVADARLHRLADALVRHGCTVEVIALGKSEDAPLGVHFRSAQGGNGFRYRILRDLLLPLRTTGKVVVVLAPDLLPITWLVTRIRKQKLVADIYEDYLQLLRDRSWAKGLIGALATVVARTATMIAARAELTTVADAQVPPFRATNRLVVRNLPDMNVLTPSGDLDEMARAIYIGDLRSSRGLRTMIKVVELTPKWKFDFVGAIAPDDQGFVNDWLASNPAANRATFHGRQSPINSWKLAKGAWVGLSLLESTPAFVDAVPSKLYEYLAVGLAIISTPLPRCVTLIHESGSGVIASDPKAISEQLIEWGDDPTALMAIRAKALAWAQDHFDAKAEYEAFAVAVEGLINRSR
jgi:glycosyltransferase involved in cell wall biosynthesis